MMERDVVHGRMHQTVAALLRLLQESYDPGVHELVPIYEHAEKAIYRIDRRDNPPWIVRLFSPTRPLERVRGDAAVLRYVATHGISAERIVPAGDGADCVSLNGRGVLVTEWIEGERPDRSPETLRRLGEVVGRLHALPPVPEQDPLLLRRAGALPASDLPFGLQCLARIADRVPNEWRAEYTTLRAHLLATGDCEDLPDSARGLIHNDCHLANALRTPQGEVVFFDWDSAGQGPRVAALGLLLYSCVIQAPDDPPIPSDLTRVDRVLDGYCRHHALSDAELRLLPDAVRYRSAVVAARELAATVDHRRAGDLARWHSGWWARFAEADAVATRALTTLERYRAA